MERLITIAPVHIDRMTTLAEQKWTSADVRTMHDVYDILDLARYVLGGEIPQLHDIVLDGHERLDGDGSRILVRLGHGFYVASGTWEASSFSHANGGTMHDVLDYVLTKIVDIHNQLINRFKEGL